MNDRVLAFADCHPAGRFVAAVAAVTRGSRAHAQSQLGGPAGPLLALLDHAEHADPPLLPGLGVAFDLHRIELARAVEQLLFLVERRVLAAIAVGTRRRAGTSDEQGGERDPGRHRAASYSAAMRSSRRCRSVPNARAARRPSSSPTKPSNSSTNSDETSTPGEATLRPAALAAAAISRGSVVISSGSSVTVRSCVPSTVFTR